MPAKFRDIAYFTEVGSDANEIIQSAYGKMSGWIDQNVERIQKEVKEEMDKAANEFGDEMDQFRKELDAMRKEDELLAADFENSIKEISKSLPDEKATQLTAKVQLYLVQRRQKFEQLGATAVKTGVSALKKIAGIPI